MTRFMRTYRTPMQHSCSTAPMRGGRGHERESDGTRLGLHSGSAVPGVTTIRSRIVARLCDTRGFMLAEQLVSVIFIGLLCVAVAAGLGAALSAYSGIIATSNASMLLSQTVQEVSDELAFSLSANSDGSFVSETTRASATMDSDASGIVMKDDSGSSTVLVAPKNGLTPEFSSAPSYDVSSNTWTFTVTIKQGAKVVAEQAMTVGRVNPAASVPPGADAQT